MNKIVALLVSHNKKKLLEKCIESLLNQKGGLPDIFVVDNDSEDGSKELLKKYKEEGKLDYLQLGRNLGGAGGYENGVREVVDRGYNFVWFLNDDSIPTNTALLEFKKAHNRLKGRYGFLTGKLIWKDKKVSEPDIPQVALNKRLENLNSDLARVEFASLASCFVQASVIKKVFLPIGEFFVGYTDEEYTRRISRKYPCYYVKNSVTLHYTDFKLQAGLADVAFEHIKDFDYSYRNKVYVYKREGLEGMVKWCYDVGHDAAKVVLAAGDHRCTRLKAMALGTIKGFLYNPTIDRA